MMFVILGVIYWVIRGFGPVAQAGFGIGSRVMQRACSCPSMALAFGAAPLAGQNFGARRYERVRATFRHAAVVSSVLMLALTLICQAAPHLFIRAFSKQPEVVSVGAEYLRIISWNFVATGLIFTCSGLFQALGNTWPSLLSSASRLLTFVVPAVWLSTQPDFSAQAGLAPVGGDRGAAGADESVAAATGVPLQAEPCGGRGRPRLAGRSPARRLDPRRGSYLTSVPVPAADRTAGRTARLVRALPRVPAPRSWRRLAARRGSRRPCAARRCSSRRQP